MPNIRTSRKSGFILRSGVMRRETIWFQGGYTSNTLASASSAVLSGILNAAALALRPFTVVRTRGVYFVKSDQTGATEAYESSMGMAVVSDQAAAIGVTAVPTPETDRASDAWFVYESIADQFLFISGVGVQGGNVGRQLQFDSKAMRKVEDGFTIAVVQENSALQASGTTQVLGFRQLIKLH